MNNITVFVIIIIWGQNAHTHIPHRKYAMNRLIISRHFFFVILRFSIFFLFVFSFSFFSLDFFFSSSCCFCNNFALLLWGSKRRKCYFLFRTAVVSIDVIDVIISAVSTHTAYLNIPRRWCSRHLKCCGDWDFSHVSQNLMRAWRVFTRRRTQNLWLGVSSLGLLRMSSGMFQWNTK